MTTEALGALGEVPPSAADFHLKQNVPYGCAAARQ
jgi:hypothetical protein